jgi:predicted secreted protein
MTTDKRKRRAKMFKKFTLTMVTVILLISLAGCNVITSSTKSTDDGQNDGVETITETGSADNYQMLPLISGKVANIQLDASADSTTQQLKVGEILSITLESNITTGYSWYITLSNPELLLQLGDPLYQEPPSSGETPVLGAAGKLTYFLQAAKTGTTTVTLEYKQGANSSVAPAKTVTFTVEVE